MKGKGIEKSDTSAVIVGEVITITVPASWGWGVGVGISL